MQPQPLTYDDTIRATNLCIQAYLDVKAKLPKNAGYSDTRDNHDTACVAFLTKLPILIDPASFQLYIACIAKGASIGVIDPVDIGRFCHIAQTAMSAWKLINLIIPAAAEKREAAQRKEKEAAEKGEKKATLPPPKGNHPGSQDGQSQPQQPAQEAKHPPKGEEKATPLPPKGNQPGECEIDQAILHALENMPVFEIQKQHFQLLRSRGHLLPSDPELRDNPLAALHFVRMAEQTLSEEALAGIPPRPQPASEPAPEERKQPQQAA